MSRFTKLLACSMIALVASVVVVGCTDPGKPMTGSDVKAQPMLCTKCGQMAGTKQCCMEGAAKCGSCGLDKASPGCCKIPKDATGKVGLCTKCGQIKGTDSCCKPDAVKCEKCGLDKASPGCCKITMEK